MSWLILRTEHQNINNTFLITLKTETLLLLYWRGKSIHPPNFSLHTTITNSEAGKAAALFSLACQREEDLTHARYLATAAGFNREPTWLQHQTNKVAGRWVSQWKRVEDLFKASWNHSHFIFFFSSIWRNAFWRPDKHFRIHKDK